MKGLYFYNQGGVALEKSKGYFEQAIEQDPDYAIAYARLADLYTYLPWQSNMPAEEAYTRARAAAEKALELDGALAEAHSALGSVKVYADWDWLGAERELQKRSRSTPIPRWRTASTATRSCRRSWDATTTRSLS